MDRVFRQGDMVQHFKRETVDQTTKKYLYRIIGEAIDSETRERVMVYQALYDDCGTFVRPYEMFMSEVDHEKYPDIKQKYRFETVNDRYRPDVKKTMESLRKNGFDVTYFDTAEEAAEYLDRSIDGKSIGFGDSVTLSDMKAYERLSSHNEVRDPKQGICEDDFQRLAREALTAEVFITSVNGLAETGEMVNIDGTGNRIAGSLYGHKSVYFVAGINKIMPNLETAVHRARNIAGPMDAKKYGTPPCTKGEMHCYDCNSPDRICNAEIHYLKKMNHLEHSEVILIGEQLGY